LNNGIAEKDFIKCGSPLGEYELHCTKEIKQQILENQDKIDEYERVGIIKCPICGEIEVTPYGDDEYLPNLRCCNCNHVWLANGKLDDKDNLINQIRNNQAIVDEIKRVQKYAMNYRDITIGSICKQFLEKLHIIQSVQGEGNESIHSW